MKTASGYVSSSSRALEECKYLVDVIILSSTLKLNDSTWLIDRLILTAYQPPPKDIFDIWRLGNYDHCTFVFNFLWV